MKKPPPMRQGSPDDFQTPATAIEPLAPYLNPSWRIWEPSCGKGNIVRALQAKGFQVHGDDIKATPPRCFLSHDPPPHDCVVTNPPYSIKNEFLARCYRLGNPFALLMPLTTFDSAERQRLFHEKGIQVLFLPRRVKFETPNGKGSSAWFMTAWFCWQLGLPATLTFTGLDNPMEI